MTQILLISSFLTPSFKNPNTDSEGFGNVGTNPRTELWAHGQNKFKIWYHFKNEQ